MDGKVIAFRTFCSNARMGLQLRQDRHGPTFKAYGCVLDKDARHADFEPLESGGKGLSIPDGSPMSEAEARFFFSGAIEDLERSDLHWRR